MRTYKNDQHIDSLAYDYLNANWQSHSADNAFTSFVDCVASFELSTDMKVALFALLTAVDAGVISFMQDVANDLSKERDELPEFLPSVHLVNQGKTNSEMLRIAPKFPTRTLLQ